MKRKISVVLICALFVSLFAFAACSAEDKIVGTWTSQQTTLGVVTESTLIFNEDGTGSVSGLLGITGAMTYVITDNTITLTYDILGIETVKSYTFAIEKESLSLTEGANTVTFTRAA